MSRNALSVCRPGLQPILSALGGVLIASTSLSAIALGQPAGPSFAAPTITVTMERDRLTAPCIDITTADLPGLPGGQVSLREAVCAANNSSNAEVIGFDRSGVYSLDIVGAGEDANETGDLDISAGDLTIQHDGRGEVVIEAAFSGGPSDSDRVLHVQAGSSLLLRNVTIRNGAVDDVGGGILNEGKLELVDVEISGNRAIHGGGLYNRGGVVLRDSAFSDNEAALVSLGSGLGGTGGGIANADGGFMTALNVDVLGNRAFNGGGFGILGGQVDARDGRIGRNEAVNNGGGAFNARSGSLAVVDTAIEQNSAGGGGGGIAAFGTLDVWRGQIAENRADLTGGGIVVGGHFSQPTTARLNGVRLERNNSAAQPFPPFNSPTGGGAIYSFRGDVQLTDAVVRENKAASHGGGIFARFGEVVIKGTTIDNNVATTGGGGIFASENGLDVAGSAISDNVTGAYGGGIFVGGTSLQNRVGASVVQSVIAGNRVENSNGPSGGGGIASAGAADLLIQETLIAGNSSNHRGGGVSILTAVNLEIERSTFSANKSGADGGGLASLGNTPTGIANSTFLDNTAEGRGGAIDVVDGTVLQLVHNTIVGNSAATSGGGMHFGTVNAAELYNNLVTGNESGQAGHEITVAATSHAARTDYNLFGHGRSTSAEALANFAPSGNDLLATSDGNAPHDLGRIVETKLGRPDNSTGSLDLPAGSPAIDNAANGWCLPHDQRGNHRPIGAACDIGSVEYHAPVTASVAE